MAQARRAGHPLPVVSTHDHAAMEAAFLAAAGKPARPEAGAMQIGPAELSTSVSRSRITVGRAAEQPPAELSAWVAPLVVVSATSK